MNWEDKYMEKLDNELRDLRHQINNVEKKITDSLDRSMTRLIIANKERTNEYISMNQRIDSLSGKVDRSLQWIMKFTVGTFVAICSLVVAAILRML